MALAPRPGVSLRVAVLSEACLTYLLNLVILYATSKYPPVVLEGLGSTGNDGLTPHPLTSAEVTVI